MGETAAACNGRFSRGVDERTEPLSTDILRSCVRISGENRWSEIWTLHTVYARRVRDELDGAAARTTQLITADSSPTKSQLSERFEKSCGVARRAPARSSELRPRTRAHTVVLHAPASHARTVQQALPPGHPLAALPAGRAAVFVRVLADEADGGGGSHGRGG